MGSDYAMNPPIPVYDTEIIYDVDGHLNEKVAERLAALVKDKKQFKAIAVKDGYRIDVFTGVWR